MQYILLFFGFDKSTNEYRTEVKQIDSVSLDSAKHKANAYLSKCPDYFFAEGVEIHSSNRFNDSLLDSLISSKQRFSPWSDVYDFTWALSHVEQKRTS